MPLEGGVGGLLGKQEHWVPERRAAGLVVDHLRAELLEEGQLSEETAILAVLLGCGRVIKRHLFPYEQTEIRKTVKGPKQTPTGRMARELTEYVENLPRRHEREQSIRRIAPLWLGAKRGEAFRRAKPGWHRGKTISESSGKRPAEKAEKLWGASCAFWILCYHKERQEPRCLGEHSDLRAAGN